MERDGLNAGISWTGVLIVVFRDRDGGRINCVFSTVWDLDARTLALSSFVLMGDLGLRFRQAGSVLAVDMVLNVEIETHSLQSASESDASESKMMGFSGSMGILLVIVLVEDQKENTCSSEHIDQPSGLLDV